MGGHHDWQQQPRSLIFCWRGEGDSRGVLRRWRWMTVTARTLTAADKDASVREESGFNADLLQPSRGWKERATPQEGLRVRLDRVRRQIKPVRRVGLRPWRLACLSSPPNFVSCLQTIRPPRSAGSQAFITHIHDMNVKKCTRASRVHIRLRWKLLGRGRRFPILKEIAELPPGGSS